MQMYAFMKMVILDYSLTCNFLVSMQTRTRRIKYYVLARAFVEIYICVVGVCACAHARARACA